MKKYILGTLGVAVVLLFVNPAFASTGPFTGPLLNPILSVDLNGGPSVNAPQSAASPTEGWNGSAFTADPYGVTWSPWGGPTYNGGDGTQLPSSQTTTPVNASSISKTFGSIGATLSIDTAVNSTAYAQINGVASMNSRDRGNPSPIYSADNDMFRDFIFAGTGSGPIQGMNYLTLSLSGLTAGVTYAVALYSYDYSSGNTMNWTATAPTLENSKNGWWDGTTDNTFTAPADEQTITWTTDGATTAPAIFDITANGSGDITVYGFGGNGVTGNQNASSSYLDGFQIGVVPEPTSMALLGLGALVGTFVIRRRQKA